MRIARLAVALAVAASFTAPLAAQQSSFRSEVLRDVADLERKYVSLAEAMTPAALTWRPGEGVRSSSEVLMHVVGANYLFPTFFGVKAPAETPPRESETTWTDAARILPALRASFAHLRQSIDGTSDADLERTIKMFGQDRTMRSAMLTTVTHLHEHLGQAIAYARTNRITPPWSAGGE